jgi:hypothetical protein
MRSISSTFCSISLERIRSALCFRIAKAGAGVVYVGSFALVVRGHFLCIRNLALVFSTKVGRTGELIKLPLKIARLFPTFGKYRAIIAVVVGIAAKRKRSRQRRHFKWGKVESVVERPVVTSAPSLDCRWRYAAVLATLLASSNVGIVTPLVAT